MDNTYETLHNCTLTPPTSVHIPVWIQTGIVVLYLVCLHPCPTSRYVHVAAFGQPLSLFDAVLVFTIKVGLGLSLQLPIML